MSKKYIFNDLSYELIDNYKEGFIEEEVLSKLTDYYYKRIGGFNIRLFEIEKEDMKEGRLL